MHFGHARDTSACESARSLAHMIHNEPAVRQGINLLQQHCLSGGLAVRFPGNVPPTHHFDQHIQRIFVPFCREAIQSALSVGFVPYRVRTLDDGCRVPEVLPLGTFTWSVTRDPTLLPKAWFFDRRRQQIAAGDAPSSKKRAGDGALLSYDVRSSFTEHPPHVYVFTTPSVLIPCTSPLGSLLSSYGMLCHKRQCMLRADYYNSKPSIVFEEQNALKVNDSAKQGSGLESSAIEMNDALSARLRSMNARQNLHYEAFAEAREKSQLPDDTVTLVAPVNHSVHSLDKALTPQDLHREELGFMRLVAVTLGIPPALLLQGSAVIGTAAVSTSAATMGWADSAESSNRQMIETCNGLNSHLRLLLEVCFFSQAKKEDHDNNRNVWQDVYALIYPGSGVPRFMLRALPTLCLEQLTSVFDAQLIDDDVFSSILKVCFV